MSAGKNYPQLCEEDFQEWLVCLSLLSSGSEEKPFRERIRDGVVLCQLANKIRPGSVETVSSIFAVNTRASSV